MKLFVKPFCLFGIILLIGCSQKLIRNETSVSQIEHVLNKNYKIGEINIAYVGQRVISFKDYYVSKVVEDVMRPNKSFRIKAGFSPWYYAKSESGCAIVGDTKFGDKIYKVVNIGGGAAVLVGDDGKLYPKLMGATTNILVLGEATIEPADILFVQDKKTIVDSRKGFINYELLYSGTDGKSFVLTYREYTPDDLIKAGFTQSVTYQNNLSSIRYKDIKINVHEITNEYIKYVVVSD